MKRKAVLVEYADASAETRALYDEIMRCFGSTSVPNFFKAEGSNPRILRANWEKFRNTVAEGEVSPLLKQLILFVISARADNSYCVAAHGYAALSLDPTLTCEDLACLTRGESYHGLSEAFRVAIDVVSRLALEPDRVAGGFDFDRKLRDVGFVDAEVEELVAQADFGVMMNVIMSINDVPLERPYPPLEAT
jgi:alkylhydroperoxidase family enzyme